MKFLILLSLIFEICYTAPVKNDLQLTLIGNKKLYFVTDFKLNFYQAEHFCRRKNMSLFTINSQTEQNNIVAYIKDNGYTDKSFWTSGNDLGEEGQFYWLYNAKKMIYTNWKYGEPNNYNVNGVTENCVLIWYKTNYKWNDGHCHVPEYFICEL